MEPSLAEALLDSRHFSTDGRLGYWTPAQVERARVLIEDCGARDATVALADEYLDLALSALDRVSLVPGPKSDLVAIARFVTERDR